MNNEEVLKKINSGEYKTMTIVGRSVIWSCFSQILKEDGTVVDSKVYCRNCEKIFKYHKRQTSNLVRHSCVHSKQFDSAPKQLNSANRNACIDTFMNFTIEDCQPSSIIEGSGFRKVITKCIQMGAKYGEDIDLGTLIPNANTLARKSKLKAVEKRNKISPYIQNIIANSEAAATIQMWSDDLVKRNFLGVTLHFQKDFKLVDITLGIKSMDFMSKTADSIRNKLYSLFREYGVTDISNMVFVTDGESDIVNALKHSTVLICSAHLFSNVLNDAFASTHELEGITFACNRIVKYFKQVTKHHMLDTTVQSHFPAKWNYNFAMFKSIFENYKTVIEALADNAEMHSILNFNSNVIQGLVGICNDFEIIFQQLQSSTSPTICFVVPSINKVKMICVIQQNDKPEIIALKRNILMHLEKWKSNLGILHKAALFLFPPAISMQWNEIPEIKDFCIANLIKNDEEFMSDVPHLLPSSSTSGNSQAMSGSNLNPCSSQSLQSFASELLPCSSSSVPVSEPDTSHFVGSSSSTETNLLDIKPTIISDTHFPPASVPVTAPDTSNFVPSSSSCSTTTDHLDIKPTIISNTPFPPPLSPSSSSVSASEPAAKNVAFFFFPTLKNDSNSNLETGRDEVECYCNENVRLTDDFDVMLWWKNNSNKYPKLSKLALKILSIPATTAPSERVFALAENIKTEKRNRLEPKTVDSILFLNSLKKQDIW